jgi:hypothetical protein
MGMGQGCCALSPHTEGLGHAHHPGAAGSAVRATESPGGSEGVTLRQLLRSYVR